MNFTLVINKSVIISPLKSDVSALSIFAIAVITLGMNVLVARVLSAELFPDPIQTVILSSAFPALHGTVLAANRILVRIGPAAHVFCQALLAID